MADSEKLKLRPNGLNWREIEGEVVVLDLEGSNYVTLNPTGSMLWWMLDLGATREELAARLVEEFGIDGAVAAKDVAGFLASCHQQRLLIDATGEISAQT